MTFKRALQINRVLDGLLLLTLGAAFLLGLNYVARNVGGSGIQLPFNAFFWIAIVFFMLLSIVRISFVSRLYISKTLMWYLGFVVCLLFPLLYTDTLFLDVEKLKLVAIGLSVLYLVLLHQSPSAFFKKYLLLILFVSTLIQTVWGFIQYYFIFESSLLFIVSGPGNPYGAFQQVNVFASYLGVGCLLALYYCYKAKSNKIAWGVFTIIVLLVNNHLIMLSGADSGRLSALLSLFFYLCFIGYKRKRLLSSAIVFCLCLFFAFSPKDWFDVRPAVEKSQLQKNPTEIVQESESEIVNQPLNARQQQPIIGQGAAIATQVEEQKNWGTRPTIYSVALKMIIDKPLTGHGIGSFSKQYLLYQGEYLKEHPDAPAEFYLAHAHNELLHWTIELGIVAALAFLLLLCVWLVSIFKGKVDPLILLLAMPLVFHSMLEIPFYNSIAHLMMFLSIVFIAGNQRGRRVKIPRATSLALIPGAAWSGFTLVIFILSTMHALTMFLNFSKTDRQEVKYLLAVNNPAAFKLRYEFELFQWKLRKAREDGKISRDDLQGFLFWAFSTTQYAPMESTYENFIEALLLAGNKKSALEYANEGAFIYPFNSRLQQYRNDLTAEQ